MMTQQVFAILRDDEFQGASAPIDVRVTVKSVALDEGFARAEVERLNGVNRVKGVRYWFQVTRLVSDREDVPSSGAGA